MPSLNMIQALNSALDTAMTADPNVLSFGQDTGYFGGVFRVTTSCSRSTASPAPSTLPSPRGGIVATAIGMAVYGLRPCVEIQFADYIYPGYDQLVSEAAKIRYRSGGEFTGADHVRTPTAAASSAARRTARAREPVHPHRRAEDGGCRPTLRRQGHAAGSIADEDPVALLRSPSASTTAPFGRLARPAP
jgi:2-oxoisovalerate dehydrogenase E1 component beta subunit